MKTSFKLITITIALTGLVSFVSTAHAQTIPTGPEADPYWRQFVSHQNALQLAPVKGGIESDVYWSQFLPQEFASARIDNAEVSFAGGPQMDPYWSQFLPDRDTAVAVHMPTGPQIGIVTMPTK